MRVVMIKVPDNTRTEHQVPLKVKVCGLCPGDVLTFNIGGPQAMPDASGCASLDVPEHETLTLYEGAEAYLLANGIATQEDIARCGRPTILASTGVTYTSVIQPGEWWAVYFGVNCPPGACGVNIRGARAMVWAPTRGTLTKIVTVRYGKYQAGICVYQDVNVENTYSGLYAMGTYGPFFRLPAVNPVYPCVVRRSGEAICSGTPIWGGAVYIYYV